MIKAAETLAEIEPAIEGETRVTVLRAYEAKAAELAEADGVDQE